MDWGNIDSAVVLGKDSHFVHIQFKDRAFILDWDILAEVVYD